MTEQTYFAPSPVPDEPSPESQRLVKRMSGNRKLSERTHPRGMSLRMARLSMRVFGQAWRSPKGALGVRFGDVRGRLVSTSDSDWPRGVLLWVHGGGLVSGTPRMDQHIAAGYCERIGIPAFVPRYRLAPEHPFPAAADDVLDAYRALLGEGFAASSIRLAGVSAGGALVAGLLGDLTREGLEMPGAALLISPVLDLTAATAHRTDAAKRDPFISPTYIERAKLAYAAGTPMTHPRLDLLGADMRGWPPILVQTGGLECVSGDAELLGARMRAAGARCEVQLWPGQIHGFTFFKTPEGRAAFDYGARFLESVTRLAGA
jgi:monoterpene epsilon-lactone hydrolase